MEKASRALIAEEDFQTRWRMKRLMEPHLCCDIAVNSSEVLFAFEISQEDGTPYDLMLMDLALPGRRFLETVKEIRRSEDLRKIAGGDRIKFVAISSIDTPRQKLLEIQSHCEGHIVKPLRKGDFLGQLHSMGFLQS